VSTGSKLIDDILEGGLEPEVTTTIYGPSGSGKTNIAILIALNTSKDKKVIFIDTEGGFSIERAKQLFSDYEKRIENLIISKPNSFFEQSEIFNNLEEISNKNDIGLIIVDSISMLYRLEKGEREAYDVNKELARQLSILRKISHDKKIPVVLTNQVYADFENNSNIKMVGGDLMKYTSKCIIQLRTDLNGRKLKLVKHRSIPPKKVNFEITSKNIIESSGTKKFEFSY